MPVAGRRSEKFFFLVVRISFGVSNRALSISETKILENTLSEGIRMKIGGKN